MDKASLVLVSASMVFMGGLVWKAMATPPPSSQGPGLSLSNAHVPLRSDDRGERSSLGASDDDRPRAQRQAPMALTASDGTGLALTSLVARAEVQDPLAFTELRLTFQNPEARQLEGTFRITLPEGASVSRFAMKIDGRWQEGEVVEKQAARVAYEDFLHRKQDPALLEQAGGNEFSARVFPIPPRGVKEIILSYSQQLPGGTTYTLPLRGLPELGVLDVSVNEEESRTPLQSFQQRRFVPNGDFVLDTKLAKSNVGLRTRNMVLTKVRAPLGEAGTDKAASSDPLAGAIVLVDTSASRALGYEDQISIVAGVIKRLAQRAPDAPVRVAAFDQVVVSMFAGKARDFGQREIDALKARMPLGASNLERALDWAAAEAPKAGTSRVIVVGDGVATAGNTEGEAFDAALRKAKEAGIARVDAIAVGGIRDATTLRRLATGSFARDGMVIDGALGAAHAMRRLDNATLANVDISVPGARWFWPTKMEGVQAGDEVMVYADVPEGEAIQISVGGKPPMSPELRNGVAPLLERAWVQAKIASLVELQGRSPQPERVKQILDLSVNHRVLSPYTALLVLETERDYARFNIDRKALRDILSMETGNLTLKQRPWPFDQQEVAKSDPSPKGARAKGEEGSTGMDRRFGVRGPSGAADGEVGSARGGGNPPAPVSEVARPRPEAAPPAAAPAQAREREEDRAARPSRDEIGDAFGAGGLGLSGVGEGGGGRGEGIGLGNIGTLGHGAGPVSDSVSGLVGQGFGQGHGRLGGSHATNAPRITNGVVSVSGALPSEVIQRIVRQNFGRFRLCYENGLRRNPVLTGRVAVRFTIDKTGAVTRSVDGGSDLHDPEVVGCVVRSMSSLSFPEPGGEAIVTYPLQFSPEGGSVPSRRPNMDENWTTRSVDPYSGKFKTVMSLVKSDPKAALTNAIAWRTEAPGDVLALVALGEAYEANDERVEAARAYGSLIDLFAARADLRRFAGERLERIKEGVGLELAVDSYQKAALQRPDHPASHRLLAFARLRNGDVPGAFDAALNGARRKYPSGRFLGVDRILREDLGLIGAAWLKKEPGRRAEVMRQLAEVNASLETSPSLRFVLNWETDANDVDFHIMDAKGGHAYYGAKALPSGGELYDDVTTGYGPECFTVRKGKGNRAGPYKLQAHYYSRGPMGYGMGKLEIIDHDGRGGLTFEQRPYVVMVDRAFVDLGTVDK